MSCFVVRPETIGKVVEYLSSYEPGWSGIRADRLLGKERFDLNIAEDRDRLGLEMDSLNKMAYLGRYESAKTETMPDWNGYDQSKCCGIPAIRVLKALKCWIYQCSEGEIVEHPLYKLMETVANDMADEIVCAMPEYDKAPDWE